MKWLCLRLSVALAGSAAWLFGQVVYVANQEGSNVQSASTVSAYTINGSSGALTAIPGSPFVTGTAPSPSALAVDPAGKFLYLASNVFSSSVAAYAINA